MNQKFTSETFYYLFVVEFIDMSGGFSKHFLIPPFLCFRLSLKRLNAFSHAKDVKKSAGGLHGIIPLPQ